VLINVLSQRAGAALFQAFLPVIKLSHEHYLRRMYGDPRRISPGTAEGYKAPLSIPGAYQYPLCIVRCWRQDMRRLEAMLPKIAHSPTLLMWGSRDRVIAPNSAAQLQHQFRNCRLLMLEGVGHLPYEETPEDFNRAVLDFLEGD
jgi:pimeloyl-ACP methyl ester carboxylesterase